VLHDQVPLSTMTGVMASGLDFKPLSHLLTEPLPQEIFEQARPPFQAWSEDLAQMG